MPRTPITPQAVVVTGLALVPEPGNVDGNTIPLSGRQALQVVNGSAASINVTIPSSATVEGLAVSSRVVAVPAGATRHLRSSEAGRQAGNVVNVDYSAVASVTVALLEV